MPANKKLGQHWLQDPLILQAIADYAKLNKSDFVVEVGPGLGTLTSKLLKSDAKVLAIEFDEKLASDLPKSFPGKTNLEVVNSDIRTFNFEELQKNYKLVANLPYYISGIFFRNLIEMKNKPSLAVVLVQKEVAEKMAQSPENGNSNKLAMLINYFYKTELGIIVGIESFSPPPKVKSQVIILEPREETLFNIDFKRYSQLVKFSFSSPRKTLVNNLCAGLRISKQEVSTRLTQLNLNLETRAEELSLEQWQKLFRILA
ncbi:MAG: ribosomal RNA small subunit methyltransferase A [Candidatus Nomurabacteria bacterium]|nr:MAG: ribosomal RNA small subunit methyltransferase A [Candidatus Nomurabacteria bacterium]HRV76001.1 16S rRNA (adenine(1518)-N(6)/adenine(1519)-N(6))-dimethyltransferase RsmA [Candidatus Saccharimonadales bacterium]